MASATIDIAYNRLVRDVVSAFDEVRLKGGTVPSSKVSANLAAAIRSISAGVTVFGAIVVDFPAGSTCTCSNGSTIYTAGSTGGNWVFTVPVAGTWTVTAVDGVNTASQTVEIATQGQGVRIELSYVLKLYKPELEQTVATTQWSTVARNVSGGAGAGGAVITRNTDNMVIAAKNHLRGGCAYYTEQIDLTEYRTLTFDGILSSPNVNGNWNMIGVWTALTGAYDTAAVASALAEKNNLERRIITVDVSNLAGLHYVGFGTYCTTGNLTVYSLELSK